MYYYFLILIIMIFFSHDVLAQGMEGILSDESGFGDQLDFGNDHIYQIEGSSMEIFGLDNDAYVDVVPATRFEVGDIIAFECAHEKCDRTYVKKITNIRGSCYWVEGRDGIWVQDGKMKKSIDSRTTFGWLCDDQINILGIVFLR